MKKLILIVCLFILVITFILYFLIPNAQNLNYQTTVGCTESAVSRYLINKNKWHLWWPGQIKDSTNYSYKNCNYRFGKILLDGIGTTVLNDKDSVKGFLKFIYFGNDSTQFQWTSNYIFSANPVKRFTQYLQLKNIANNIENLLGETKKYFEKEENIYGMKVLKQKVTESSLISVKDTFPHYPSTQEIYGMINSLKEYIRQKGGHEDSYPMLNVNTEDSIVYETMVAIPTKNDMPSEGKFHLKKMVLGNILMAEVKGGVSSVIKGEKELTNYVNDHKKTSPAIPFQSLVTNRLLESDTSKWITRLYYPIFF